MMCQCHMRDNSRSEKGRYSMKKYCITVWILSVSSTFTSFSRIIVDGFEPCRTRPNILAPLGWHPYKNIRDRIIAWARNKVWFTSVVGPGFVYQGAWGTHRRFTSLLRNIPYNRRLSCVLRNAQARRLDNREWMRWGEDSISSRQSNSRPHLYFE